jgi:hypothetical protein
VHARAYVVRAEVYVAIPGRVEEAMQDAKAALDLLRVPEDGSTVRNILKARAYRVEADVHEVSGNYQSAADALRAMAACNPAMRTKVAKELERLQQAAS